MGRQAHHAVGAHEDRSRGERFDHGAEDLRRQIGGQLRAQRLHLHAGLARLLAVERGERRVHGGAEPLPLLRRRVGLAAADAAQRRSAVCRRAERAHARRRAGWRRRASASGVTANGVSSASRACSALERRRRARVHGREGGQARIDAALRSRRERDTARRRRRSCAGVLGAQDEAIAAEGRDRLAQHQLRVGRLPRRQRGAAVEPDDLAERLGGADVDAHRRVARSGRRAAGRSSTQASKRSVDAVEARIADDAVRADLGALDAGEVERHALAVRRPPRPRARAPARRARAPLRRPAGCATRRRGARCRRSPCR